MPADPREIVLAEGRSGDDAKAVLREAGHSEVTLDAATRIQHLRIRDGTDVSCDSVVAQVLEIVGGTRAEYLDLGEGGLVEEGGGLTAGVMLGTDRRRPDLARPPAWAQALVSSRRIRLEPVRPLPAGLLPEGGAEFLQPGVGRRESERPAGLPLLARVLDVVVGGVDLDRAREGVLTARVVAAEAPRVHLPCVETGNALDDPLGDQLAHPAGAGEAVGAEARGDPEASYVRLPQDELPIGGEGFRPVDQPHHLEVLEIRHADDRVLEELVESLPVLGQELAVEVLRNPVQCPGRRVALIASHHEATRLPA